LKQITITLQAPWQ